MKIKTQLCLICIIFMLFVTIIAPPITGADMTKADGIFTAVLVGPWILVFIVFLSTDSADYEWDIDDLKNRIHELEDKLKEKKDGKN